MRRLFGVVPVAVIVACAWGSGAEAQPISTVSEVAGKWSGAGARGGKTDIEIEPSGRFQATSPAGTRTGMARIENGTLILPFSDNQGQIKFTRTEGVLEGPYVVGTMTGTVRVQRAAK